MIKLTRKILIIIHSTLLIQSRKEHTMNPLVIYYSYEGNTAVIAETIADYFHCGIIRLRTKKEMKSTGFMKFMWGGKQVVMKDKPELEPFNSDFSPYDVVFVGSPVWAWTYTPAIRTLVENGYLKGKKIYFFTTSGGDKRKVEDKTKELIIKDNQWMGYKDFINVLKNRDQRIAEAISWIKSLPID